MKDHLRVGREGEEAGARFLKRKRFRIKERNLRLGGGELDIVAEDRGTLVFVEVKAGQEEEGFSPLLHFDQKKKKQLLHLAKAYLMRYPEPPEVRFDLLVVTSRGKKHSIEHFRDVLKEGENEVDPCVF